MIISESPLFTLPRLIRNPQRVSELILQQVRALNRDQQRSFFALRNSFKGFSPFEEIVKTNAMPLGTNASVVGYFLNVLVSTTAVALTPVTLGATSLDLNGFSP